MKTIPEKLGGAQILFPISYDIQRCFEEYLTDEHRFFIALLRVIEDAQPWISTPCVNADLKLPVFADEKLPVSRPG